MHCYDERLYENVDDLMFERHFAQRMKLSWRLHGINHVK